jgi:hypothetical protein
VHRRNQNPILASPTPAVVILTRDSAKVHNFFSFFAIAIFDFGDDS